MVLESTVALDFLTYNGLQFICEKLIHLPMYASNLNNTRKAPLGGVCHTWRTRAQHRRAILGQVVKCLRFFEINYNH